MVAQIFKTEMQRMQLIDFPISIGSYFSFVDHIISLAIKKSYGYICIANVHMLIEFRNDPQFAEVVKNADIITPDGMPLIWGLSIIHGVKQERVAGMDLLPDLLQKMMTQKLSVYFYGGSPLLLNKSEILLKKKFPTLKLAGFFSPPFRDLTQAENADIIDTINHSGANIVFIILGCPKQEKWMASMKGKINSCLIGVGGALPVMMGMHKRAPSWMQNNGLEWFFRLYQEPRRLFKRYAYTNTLFLWLFMKEYLKVKIFKPLGFLRHTG